MRSRNGIKQGIMVGTVLVWLTAAAAPADAQPAASEEEGPICIVALQGNAEIIRAGTSVGVVTETTNQFLRPFDRLRTGENTRIALRWSDDSMVYFGELTEIEVLPPHATGAQTGLQLVKGILSFFHRDMPARIRVITRGAVAGIEGTEFVVEVETVNDVERTTLSVIDGIVRFANPQQTLVLTNGEQAVASPGQAPVRTPGFVAHNVLQWCFYYPAVLDPRDLSFTPEEEKVLGESLAAYRAGDLLAALAEYPADRQPASDAERIFHAGLLLSVGQVEKTESALAGWPAGDSTDRLSRLASALRQLIAAVRRQPNPAEFPPQLGTELLASSYYEQSRGVRGVSLGAALHLARQAATTSPEFGFAWARVAELEFSFGHTGRALEALNRSLALAPRNAQALALKGFLFAAQNRTRAAIEWFEQAIRADSALGNAWLGRGLCRIRRGDAKGGREDLLVAAALEPQRALLRSYLGKAYADAGRHEQARHELDLARRLDSADPTALLYSALLHQQRNRINEGIRDLEKAQELNEHRALYRSELLLDQDLAVRSANLAALYRDAGMREWSVQEAGRAVSEDYANYSAHLFLANSYDQLRDPYRINLRFETPAESEYLIANLLAPVGGGLLAPSVSQQEYSRLFERERLGITSTTEFLSRGAWAENGAQFGVFRNSSYLFEAGYRTDPGQRINADFEERVLSLHLKQQVTPQDSLYVRIVDYEAEGGDLRQYYDQRNANPGFRSEETQDPTLHVGYHREWRPGMHTLALAGRLDDTYSVEDPLQSTLFLIKPPDAPPTEFHMFWANGDYRSTLEIYTAELQQIWQQGDHNTIFGGRFQTGEIRTRNLQTNPMFFSEIAGYFDPTVPVADQEFSEDFERFSLYLYHHWQIWPALRITGGLTYDWIAFPANFRAPPLSGEEETEGQLSPKAGLIWTPHERAAVRFAYARALAGATIDQTFLLEPSQVAGFNQSFRSILPESISGANAGSEFEIFGLALEQKIGAGTYCGLSGQILNSDVERMEGTFRYDGSTFFAYPSGTEETLDYTEKSLLLSVNQLVRNEWSLGVSYRLTHADLEEEFTEVAASTLSIGVQPEQDLRALLHQVAFQSGYNHPCGFFALGQALWSQQDNHGYSPELRGDDFWQINAFVGFRFPRRKAEVRLGFLNLTDQDYQLNPLTLYDELPRARTFAARLQCSF